MVKKDLIDEVTKVVCSRKEADAAVNVVIDTIKKALKKGDKVSITGFGTFSVTKRAARTGRNPQTGEAMKIKAKKVPKFTPGKEFKDVVCGTRK
ncbi:MAG: HU family DNA-binding protein [Syntrophaceae bacterium]